MSYHCFDDSNVRLTEEGDCPQPLTRDILQASQLTAWVTLGVSLGTRERGLGPGLPADDAGGTC